MEDSYLSKVSVLSVVATKSGVGKTTLIEEIIKILKSKNYKVGVLKHDVRKFQIDYPGKDSYKFTEAGADNVVIASQSKLALIENLYQEKSIDELLCFFKNMDIVIAEGFKNNNYPKIEIHRKEIDNNLLCNDLQLNYKNFIAVASDEALDLDIPVFNLNNAAEITDFIESFFLKGKS